MPETLKGQFLVATTTLRDSNFFKTVVLIVEHDDNGAMGVVVNRPSGVTINNALSEHFDLPETGDVVYVGGPVEPRGLFILHDTEELNDDPEPVVPGVFVGNGPNVFEAIVNVLVQKDTGVTFRIFSGCAGWAPGQLEGEIHRGDWHTRPAFAEDIFDADPYQIWDEQLQSVYQSNRLLPQTIDNPEWN